MSLVIFGPFTLMASVDGRAAAQHIHYILFECFVYTAVLYRAVHTCLIIAIIREGFRWVGVRACC